MVANLRKGPVKHFDNVNFFTLLHYFTQYLHLITWPKLQWLVMVVHLGLRTDGTISFYDNRRKCK